LAIGNEEGPDYPLRDLEISFRYIFVLMNEEREDNLAFAEPPRMTVGHVLGGCAAMATFLAIIFFGMVMFVFGSSTNSENLALATCGVVIIALLFVFAKIDRSSQHRGLFAGALIALGFGALIFGLCIAILKAR